MLAGFLLLVLQAVSEIIKRIAMMRGLIPDPHAGTRAPSTGRGVTRTQREHSRD